MLRAKERARGDSHGCIACTRHDTERMQIVNTLDHCQQRTPNPSTSIATRCHAAEIERQPSLSAVPSAKSQPSASQSVALRPWRHV